MGVNIIDTLTQKNNGEFAIVDSNDVKGGYYQVDTLEQMNAIPQARRKVGMLCHVENDPSGSNTYRLNSNNEWEEAMFGGLHIGPEQPENTGIAWVDTNDEDLDEANEDSDIIIEIREAVSTMKTKVDNIEFAYSEDIDPGYYGGLLPGEEEDIEDVRLVRTTSEEESTEEEYKPDFGDASYPEGYTPDIERSGKGTVNRIRLKRGLKSALERLYEGELGFCIDTEELYIGNKGYNKLLAKVGGVGGSGSENVTGEYVELVAPNNEKYRLTVNNDGDLIIMNSKAYTDPNPALDEAARFSGLVINHVYGGGAVKANIAPCSHGFIEIYNKTENTINLKGLSLQVAESGTDWKVFPLTGIVKPLHSFLVRCAEHTDIHRKTTRFKIKNYDMHWDIALPSNGMKVYLGVGTNPLTVKNPANIDNLWSKQQGYIDLFSFGSINPAIPMDAYEKNNKYDGYLRVGNIMNSVHRRDFADTDSSFADLEALNLKYADVPTYTPRCTKDGPWTTYYNKIKLADYKPTMINLGFGKDGNTSRTFTWHTTPTDHGFLLYKKKGDPEFTVVETIKDHAWYYDTDATVHRAIIHDLTPGTYVYKAGEEGKWSDEYEFEVKVPTESDTIRILHTTDQQGIDKREYEVWRDANEIINQTEEYDFHINTGDISNDGGEFAFQWRYYYDMAPELCTKPHMTCCGNNDLTRNDVDKKKTDPVAFTWYSTYEDEHISSCYSWNYGYIHFVSLNSNRLQASDIVDQQIPWLREDLAKPENQKRWTIVYMHESPYTIIKQASLAKFIDVFAEFGVDLVLCGHHHRYSRSHRMGAQTSTGKDTIDNQSGCYYVMCQATGYKLMGKTTPAEDSKAPWRAKYDNVGNPMYIMWDVTYDNITMRPYSIGNILPETKNEFNSPEILPFNDSLVITKP